MFHRLLIRGEGAGAGSTVEVAQREPQITQMTLQQ
jgi:hypothetical protein